MKEIYKFYWAVEFYPKLLKDVYFSMPIETERDGVLAEMLELQYKDY